MYLIGENLNFDITEIGLLFFLIQFNLMFAEEVKIFVELAIQDLLSQNLSALERHNNKLDEKLERITGMISLTRHYKESTYEAFYKLQMTSSGYDYRDFSYFP